MGNRGWCFFRSRGPACIVMRSIAGRSLVFFPRFITRRFCYRARRFFWFRRRRRMRLALLGLIRPRRTFFFAVDLRTKETSKDYAGNERSCEPKAKGHHCDGAQQSARRDQPRMLSESTESLKKLKRHPPHAG